MDDTCFAGIDVNSRPPYYTIIALTAARTILLDVSGNWEEIRTCLEPFNQITIAINSPIEANNGFLSLSHRIKHKPGKWPDIRLIEFDLEEYGAPIYHTPKKKSNLLAGQKYGFSLVAALNQTGFSEYGENTLKSYVEVPSETAFWSIERKPLFEDISFIGRIQRQLLLLDLGLQVPDPMDFFEELTRFKLQTGNVPLEMVYELPRLNAFINAYTALQIQENPSGIAKLGYPQEGFIYLPFCLPDLDKSDPARQNPLF
jgi:hypothetical protein